MSATGLPSRTSSGSVGTIKEIGRPFQTFLRLATAWRASRFRTRTYWFHSGTRKETWLSQYGLMSMPRASSRSCCCAANPDSPR